LIGAVLTSVERQFESEEAQTAKQRGEIMSEKIEGFIKGIILGSAIGAVIGILYAPQSGRKTRQDIDRKAKDLLAKAKEEYEATLKKSNKAYESAVKELKSLESSTKDKVGEIEEKVDELTELGKEALHDTKDHLTKAVKAAAHAFK
jgi:gas vesicle protein